MHADEVWSILAAVSASVAAPDPAAQIMVVPGPSSGSWRAWLVGDDAAALAHRAGLRDASPELAGAVTWIAVDELPDVAIARADRGLRACADSALDQLVAVAWHEALGVAPRGGDEDFFAAGGHSLLAAEVAGRLKELLAIDVPLTMVLERPTVSEQASWLEAARAPARSLIARGAPVIGRVLVVTDDLDRSRSARGMDRDHLGGSREPSRVTGGACGGLEAGLAEMATRDPGERDELDLAGVRGRTRQVAWQQALGRLARPFGAAAAGWRATVVRFDGARRLVALAFDGGRFDASSAGLWIADLIEACGAPERAPRWPRRPQLAGELEATAPVAIGWRALRIAATRARALLEVGRRQAASPLATIAAAVAVVIGRRSGQPAVVFEIPASRRVGPRGRAAQGPLTTTAAVAIELADRPSFATLAERAARAICGGWAAAAGLTAPALAHGPADASLELELPGPRRAGWREVARGEGCGATLALAFRSTATGALIARIGFDGVEVSAADAEAIAVGLDAVIDELAGDPARPLVGLGAPSATGAAVAPVADPPGARLAAPLSHAQGRLWFLESLAPGTTTNHLQRIYRIEGALDHGALARSVAALARRHEALRTVFGVVDGAPVQRALPELRLDHRVDAVGSDADGPARPLAVLAAEDYARPFDLAVGPLWRTRLCRVAPGDHHLIFTIHHLIADALSFLVWYRELVEHYHADLAGTAPRVRAITSSVAQIAAWERSPAGQRRIADDLGFWLAELEGATPLELPIDHRRPPGHGLGRHEVAAALPADRVAQLRALGRHHGATLNVTLIAAAAAFLARHTQKDDLVCIVPASRRDDPGRRDVIGLVLNLLPLRLRLDGDPTFTEIVARTHRALYRALAHAEAPFERIIAGLGLVRAPGRQPLFDVILNMVSGAERLWWGELKVTLDSVTGSAQPCDLVIGASTQPGGVLGLSVRCRADLFTAATAERLMARLRAMLVAAVAAPHTRLSALPIMPDDERDAVVVGWNATAWVLPDATVHGLVEAQARERPDAIAVIQGARQLSYRELDARADRLAARLAARLPPGTHVGVLVPPSPELAVAALGVLKAGAVYVPLDPGQPAARLAIFAQQVALVVCEPATAGMIAIARLALDDPDDELRDARAAAVAGSGAPDAPAYAVFTSGSTGRPKGVVTTHRALVNQIAWFARDLPWQPGEVACLRSSPAFVDSLWELFGPLAGGVPLVIATGDEMADPRLLAAVANRHGVTRMVVVPSLLRTLLELGAGRSDFLPALGLWLATSEELPPELVRAVFAARPGARLVNLYGASETADQVAAYEVVPGDADAPRIPIGRPIANTQIHVLDRAGRPQPIGVPGELCVAGVGISERYLGDAPDGDQARFAASPFVPGARLYRTGDRGRWRHDGVLEYLGRFDHLLKIRGVRIDPGEVEAAIRTHPGVAAAAVTGCAGFDGELRLTGYLVARGATAPPPDELRRFLRTTLPETWIPTAWQTLAALPLGPTGKLDRAALPAPPPMVIASRPPHGAVEHAVALAWEQLLGRPLGAEDDFFAAGGQSLLAAQLGARLSERFAVELPLGVLFERPTIAAQAAWIEAAVLRAPRAGIVRTGAAHAPLSFAQERLWFATALAPHAPAPKLRFALRLDGELDRARLEAAIAAVAARHPALRAVFTGDGPGARQRVAASCPRDHLVDDLSALGPADQAAAIRRHVDDERDRPFALAEGPPWRTRLLALGHHAHVLIVVMHHYVSDGISVQLWLDEVHEHYAALTAHRIPVVAELPVGPADVAVWQRRMADTGFWDASREYWRTTLAGAAPVELPLIAPRAGWATGSSGSVRAQVDGATADALAAVGQREATTLFGALVAALGVLLHQLTGRRDVVVGTIAAGRDRPELRPMIALLLNPLPLRLALDGDPQLRELVGAAGRVLRGALAHGEVPFERIVADVNPERRPYRQPLFDVVINHHPSAPPPRLGDLAVSYLRGLGAPVTPYELMVRTIARPRGLTVQLDFQRDRFADDVVDGWLARYVAILGRIADAPELRLSALD
jgi:amino acid adenylation domain-containing protein